MPEKNLDFKGRFRGKIISFRMSQEESEELQRLVMLSGMNKQDYIIDRLTNKEIIVQPSTRVYKALRSEIGSLMEKMIEQEAIANNDEFMDRVNTIMNILVQV